MNTTTTTYTDSLGNVFNGQTGAIVTAGSGPLNATQQGGNWVENTTGAILGPVISNTWKDVGMHQHQLKHLTMIMGTIAIGLVIIYLIKLIFRRGI